MKTYVYVDGLNLYYRAVRHTRYKWLNLARLCQLLIPRYDIAKIKYFTTRVRARPSDPDAPARQDTFLRALRTIPNLEIHYGHFLSNVREMPLASDQTKLVSVVKTEEKGSDVNLAVQMIHDAHLKRYEAAAILSNDSDLAEAIRIVRHEIGLSVVLLCPTLEPNFELKQHASLVKKIRKGVLAASQFSDTMKDRHGEFSKPLSW